VIASSVIADSERMIPLDRSVVAEDADVERHVHERLLPEVRQFLGPQLLPLLDVEPPEPPPQRMAKEKEERLIGTLDSHHPHPAEWTAKPPGGTGAGTVHSMPSSNSSGLTSRAASLMSVSTRGSRVPFSTMPISVQWRQASAPSSP
jgi:hypothetical protein